MSSDYVVFEALNSSYSINTEAINEFKFHPNYVFDSNENSYKLDNVQIPGMLKVHYVNGIPFNDFKENLCMKGIGNYVEGITEINAVSNC